MAKAKPVKLIRLQMIGRMGTGKSTAADYLVDHHGAVRFTRSEMMKALAHALVDHAGSVEELLAQLLPGDAPARAELLDQLLRYAATYEPEPGKPRALYQDVTEIVKGFDPLVFERELLQRMERVEQGWRSSHPGQPLFLLVDDVRSRDAFDFFHELGFRSLRIDASEAVRRQRMLRRDGYLPSRDTFAHASETDLDATECDFTIVNDTSALRALQQGLDRVVAELGGDPDGRANP